MRVSFVDVVGRMPEGRLRTLLAPPAETLDSILTGSDDRSVSQRIALIAFATRVVSAAIAYFSQVIMARWMGDFQYGVFVVVWVGSVIMGGLACLGIQVAVLRFVPEYRERRELDLLRGVIVGSRVQGLVTSTLFALVGLAGLYTFGDHISGYYLVPLYLGAVTLPMMALGEIQEGLARSFNWANLALWPTYIVRPLLIIVFMGGALWFGAPTNAVTAMAAVVAATYVTAIGQFFRLRERDRQDGAARAAAATMPLLWITVALPIFVVEGFFNLLTNVDILIVGRLMQPEQVAIYFAAVKTMALVHFVYFSVQGGQRPALLAILRRRRQCPAVRLRARYPALDLLAVAGDGRRADRSPGAGCWRCSARASSRAIRSSSSCRSACCCAPRSGRPRRCSSWRASRASRRSSMRRPSSSTCR